MAKVGHFYMAIDSMMQQPVENGRGHHLVGKDLAPVGKPFVRGENDRAFFVASGHQSKEKARFLSFKRQVADLIDDQHLSPS